jgi:hypothetical protein
MSTTVGNLSVELGISDEQLRAGLAQAVVAAQQAGQKMQNSVSQATQKATQSTGNMNMAILQASRGIQDFQAAGLMGMVNNVEGIASAFGLGAGVAGMATLAAVAIQSLMPAIESVSAKVEQFFGVWESGAEKAVKSVEGLMTGGFGGNALANAMKEQADFLKNRTDDASGFNIDFISQAVGLGSNEQRALENNMRRSVEASALMSKSFELAAQATRDLAAAQRGAAAQFDLTTGQQEQTGLNRQLFQASVDKYGGGGNLRTAIEGGAMFRLGMNRTEARELYGKFASGDIDATKQVESILNLASERAKIMADDFERATGSAQELQRIESEQAAEAKRQLEAEIDDIYEGIVEAADKNAQRIKERNRAIGREFDQMVKDEMERQGLQKQEAGIRENLASLDMQKMRTEIVGGSDAFLRNFNAGTSEDPVVKAIDKQTEELSAVMERLKELN